MIGWILNQCHSQGGLLSLIFCKMSSFISVLFEVVTPIYVGWSTPFMIFTSFISFLVWFFGSHLMACLQYPAILWFLLLLAICLPQILRISAVNDSVTRFQTWASYSDLFLIWTLEFHGSIFSMHFHISKRQRIVWWPVYRVLDLRLSLVLFFQIEADFLFIYFCIYGWKIL